MKNVFEARRKILKDGVMLALAASASLAGGGGAVRAAPSDSKILVAYFSRTGNTSLVARQVARALGAAMHEIRPVHAYPEDYEATVRQAQDETQRGYEPPLLERVENFGQRERVYLAFPIWGMTVPPVVRSFLSAHEWQGKMIVPLITHGGYGTGNALEVIRQCASGARLEPGFVMEGEQERRVLQRVTGWLTKSQPVPRG